MSSGPPPVVVLVLAVLVFVGGLAAALVHDDGARTTSAARSSSASTASGSSGAGTTRTSRPPVTSAITTTSGATTVRPAVATPEAAANGLWAAYAASNRVAAQRFATDDVIRVLFEVPYDGEQGTFQSCRPQADAFDCRYTQPSTQYSMIVKADIAGSFKVVDITVSSA